MKPLLVDNSGWNSFSVWEEPVQGSRYVVGIDVAEGKVRDINSAAKRDMIMSMSNEKPDYSCAIVLDMHSMRHVASWHGYVQPSDFAAICIAVGLHYNVALLAWETNNHGIVLTDSFLSFRYPNLYRRHVIAGKISDDPLLQEWGWATSASSRPLLIARVSELIESGDFTQDEKLLNELRTMEIDPSTGQPRARGRNKDDRVLALGIAAQARHEYLSSNIDQQRDARVDRLTHEERAAWASALAKRGRKHARESHLRGAVRGADHLPVRRVAPPRKELRPSGEVVRAQLERLLSNRQSGGGDVRRNGFPDPRAPRAEFFRARLNDRPDV